MIKQVNKFIVLVGVLVFVFIFSNTAKKKVSMINHADFHWLGDRESHSSLRVLSEGLPPLCLPHKVREFFPYHPWFESKIQEIIKSPPYGEAFIMARGQGFEPR